VTASAPRRIRVIWNPASGSKGGVPTNSTNEEQVRDLMARHGLGDELIVSKSEEEAIACAREARDLGYEVVVAAGGDGTAAIVAGELLESETALGVLPLGSVMNICRMLGIPRDLEAAAAIVAAGITRRIDVGFAQGEPFYESASVGMNAAIFSQLARADRGHYRAVGRALSIAFRYRPARMRIQLDSGDDVEHRALLTTVSVGPYGGLGFTLAPDAKLDDGRLDVTVFRHFSKLQLIRHLASIAFGRRAWSPHTHVYRSTTVRIDGARPLPARADARDLGTTPVEFSIRPRALKVVAPDAEARPLEDSRAPRP
jgi:diacylglycerol kinase (ATP)